MRIFLASLFVSLVLHGLVVAGFAGLRFTRTSNAKHLIPTVHLEVSHVELSFAETPDENAPVEDEVHGSKFKVQSPEIINPHLVPPDLEHETLSFKPETLNLALSAPVPAPRQASIDAPPKPRQNIRPDYPRSARLRGEEGDVVLEIAVAASGAVDDVRIVRSSGFSVLDEAAREAVRAAIFSPAVSDGRPVAAFARLTLRFRLR